MNRPETIQVTGENLHRVAEQAASLLQGGALVVIPTDTVYGLAAAYNQPQAEQRMFGVKGRDPAKPVPLLASDLRYVQELARHLSQAESRLASAFWPGPLTLVVQTASGAEGCRIPDHGVAIEVIRAAGGLLRVTSANRSGEPPALTAEEALRALGSAADLYLDAGPSAGGVPSTVVCIESQRLRVLRAGALTEEALRRELGDLIHA